MYLVNLIKSVINTCPYTLLGKKCVKLIKGEIDVKKIDDSKTLRYKNGIKLGRNISLIGVFCPFFWYSLLSGMSTDFIIMNAMHSAVIIGIGVLVSLFNYFALLIHQKNTKL